MTSTLDGLVVSVAADTLAVVGDVDTVDSSCSPYQTGAVAAVDGGIAVRDVEHSKQQQLPPHGNFCCQDSLLL